MIFTYEQGSQHFLQFIVQQTQISILDVWLLIVKSNDSDQDANLLAGHAIL